MYWRVYWMHQLTSSSMWHRMARSWTDSQKIWMSLNILSIASCIAALLPSISHTCSFLSASKICGRPLSFQCFLDMQSTFGTLLLRQRDRLFRLCQSRWYQLWLTKVRSWMGVLRFALSTANNMRLILMLRIITSNCLHSRYHSPPSHGTRRDWCSLRALPLSLLVPSASTANSRVLIQSWLPWLSSKSFILDTASMVWFTSQAILRRRWPLFRNVSNFLIFHRRIKNNQSTQKRPGHAKVQLSSQMFNLSIDQLLKKFLNNFHSKSKVVKRSALLVGLVQVRVQLHLL